MQRPTLKTGGLLAAAALTLVLGGAPLLVTGADHLDAPALGGLTDMGGDFAPHSEHGDRDINDVYVFEGENENRTVLAMTTNPAINLFGGAFGTNVRYIINVDNDGNAKADIKYVWRFGPEAGDGQAYTVVRYVGEDARDLRGGRLVGFGWTGEPDSAVGRLDADVFAGVRSDPFFFDLTGFVGTVFGLGDDDLKVLDGDSSDFFEELNTNAIVIEVPDRQLGGRHIGVWGSTMYRSGGEWLAGDQMGRPAINTVFNTSLVDADAAATKNAFNRVKPFRQLTALDGQFRKNIVTTLRNINQVLGTDTAFGCEDYSRAEARALAAILLPDIITYDVKTAAEGPLNGRALADDVIDVELAITTNGCVTSDDVAAHSDYLSTFPYLGEPHA
jgi:hypothetical protein